MVAPSERLGSREQFLSIEDRAKHFTDFGINLINSGPWEFKNALEAVQHMLLIPGTGEIGAQIYQAAYDLVPPDPGRYIVSNVDHYHARIFPEIDYVKGEMPEFMLTRMKLRSNRDLEKHFHKPGLVEFKFSPLPGVVVVIEFPEGDQDHLIIPGSAYWSRKGERHSIRNDADYWSISGDLVLEVIEEPDVLR